MLPDDTPGFLVPGGKVGLWLNFLSPTVTWILLLVFTARDHWMLGTASVLAGPILYVVTRRFRRAWAPLLQQARIDHPHAKN
jgi:hypothetical protein